MSEVPLQPCLARVGCRVLRGGARLIGSCRGRARLIDSSGEAHRLLYHFRGLADPDMMHMAREVLEPSSLLSLQVLEGP